MFHFLHIQGSRGAADVLRSVDTMAVAMARSLALHNSTWTTVTEENIGRSLFKRVCKYAADEKLTFYAPSFEKVEGAYWFGPVCPSVRPSVRL